MDPFVRGLMFYYGLEFHDLAPESILHISSFIVVCEAFLRTTPHFGLWLKTFNVEPKMIEGRQAECGEAVVFSGRISWSERIEPSMPNIYGREESRCAASPPRGGDVPVFGEGARSLDPGQRQQSLRYQL